MRVRAKVCLIGPPAVGKTSTVRRFVRSDFNLEYQATIGTVVHAKDLVLPGERGEADTQVTLIIWDIMGEHNFMQLMKDAYFFGVRGILAVCDRTRPETLEELSDWVPAVREIAGEVPTVLVGNKSDLPEASRVSEADLSAFAARYGGVGFPTSAKTGENVEAAFIALSKTLIARMEPAAPR